jgi:phage shock protein C
MNKILNVNLGGYALTIDDDAYEYLHQYLDAIKSRFSASEGRDEIIGDIENRMGELLHQKLTNRTIVTLLDVQNVVKVMGKPEDFGDATQERTSNSRNQSGRILGGIKSGRRYFRDEEDKVVGGVCSGLAAYLGIQDPVWVRIGFVLLALISAGFWGAAYIILMIVVPSAQSSADRLAMRGEPINVDNIAREVETGFERFSQKVSGFGDDFKKKSSSINTTGARGVLGQIVTAIGAFFAFILRILGKLTKGMALAIVICLVFALLLTWLVGFWSFFEVLPHLHYISPLSQSGNYSVVTLGLLLTGLPVVSFFLWFISAVFKLRTPNFLQGGLWVGWTACFVAMIFSIANITRSFKQKGSDINELSMSPVVSDTLYVKWIEQDLSSFNSLEDRMSWTSNRNHSNKDVDLLINDEALCINNLPDLHIGVSRTNDFAIKTEVYSRGRTIKEANENAASVGYRCDLEQNILHVPKAVIIPKGQKVRSFHFNLDIDVPVGKYIVLADGINENVNSSEYDRGRNNRNYFDRNPNQVYKMTTDGLVCVSCADYGSGKYESDDDFSVFQIEGPLEVEFTQDDDFVLDMYGAKESEISYKKSGDQLIIVNQTNVKKRISIRCRDIESLKLSKAVTASVFGYDQNDVSIELFDLSSLTGKMECNTMDIRMRNKSKIDLMGSVNELNLSISDQSIADLFNFKTRTVHVIAKEGSNAEIFAEDEADVLTDETSKVTISGDAELKKREKI